MCFIESLFPFLQVESILGNMDRNTLREVSRGWIRATPFEGSLQGGLRRVGKGRGGVKVRR